MLEVVLKANNKNITFISGSSTIGANDDFVQSITVKAETPLTGLEELYVVFRNQPLGESREERLLGNNTYGYKVNIPQELIDFGAHTWNWQILRRRYSSDRQSYTEISSYLYTLTVGEGLKNTNGENVTVAELQTLYLSAMDNERKSSQNATNAATSQNRAEEFAGLASTSEINAGISERNAKASEEAALGSRNTAFEAARAASNSAEDAEDAKNAAVKAKDEAVNAKTLADYARFEADASKGQAQLAQYMAETAQAKAETAQANAESAKTMAVSAMNMASTSEARAAMYAKTAKDAENYVKTTVRDVAMAKSFDNYGALVNYLKNEAPSLEVPFAIGQPFYIVETDIPDLWASGYDANTTHSYSYSSTTQFLKDLDNNGGKLWVGNYQLSKLETAKVYLGDLQTKTDSSLQTGAKTVVGAINEVNSKAVTAGNKATAIENAKGKSGGYASLNASGKVPTEQLPSLDYQPATDNRLNTENKETYKAINELDERLDDIGEVVEEHVEPLVQSVETIEQVLQQAKVQAPYWSIEAYNSRVTAGGKNVLNGSKAVLHKVVGNTATVDGTLVSATFGGIRSTGKNLFNAVHDPTYPDKNYVVFKSANDISIEPNKFYTFTRSSKYNPTQVDIIAELADGSTKQFTIGYSTNPMLFSIMNNTAYYGKTQGSPVKTFDSNIVKIGFYIQAKVSKGWTNDANEMQLQLENGFEQTAYEPYKESVLSFSKTELPWGKTIDFDQKKIIDESKVVSFNGTENWVISANTKGNSRLRINGFGKAVPSTETVAEIICSDYIAVPSNSLLQGTAYGIALDTNGNLMILDSGFESIKDISVWKEYLAQRANSGNPLVVVCYASTVTETPFDNSNKYTVWQGGTETVLDSEPNVMATLTQEYTVVNEIGQGGGSGEGGGTGGGLSESDVRTIAQSYANTSANFALSSAKSYTDGKIAEITETIGDIETALDELHTYAQSLVGGGV